jgi:metallo-beta-lactamase family protein
MERPWVRLHGAARTVTGSCYEIGLGGTRLLVDCGLFQGSRSLEVLNREPFAFDPRRIDALLLTHAHLDHCGLLPRLAAQGFRGPIWCTPATRDLLPVMLQDAARIQESDAERRNRRPDRADEPPIEPLYRVADADCAAGLARPITLNTMFEPVAGVQARFWKAGPILRAASIELALGGVRMLFSGDLGPSGKAFEPDPAAPSGLDHLFCESTYGDRERTPQTIESRRALVASELKLALAKGGNVVIPSFALERTQELLLDLARLIDSGAIPQRHVFIDSPLAGRATEVFDRHRAELEDLGPGDVFRHPSFHFVETTEESIRLNSVSGAIILAASGMCEGGRIRHHLLHNLQRADSTVIFVGYQAKGTLGRAILDGAHRVRISGRDVAVRAAIRRIESYSAHADRGELAAWARARLPVAGSLFLTHGEVNAAEMLRASLAKDFSSIVIPEIGERYELAGGQAARRLATGRQDLREALGGDWQNDYAEFAANLKHALQQIEGGAARREALRSMRHILEDRIEGRARRTA